MEQYRLIRKLGQGGYGAVYEAYQPSLDRKIAVKVLHPDLTRSPDAITRFRREGLIASRLQHPCTIDVFNLGQTEDGYLWLAMEYVEGVTLEHHLKQNHTITPQALFEILGPVCDVLTEAHEKGVIHRDLKPDNIMLTVIGDQRLPKVLDFGIASLQGSESATSANAVSGTPQYMAPEQWEGLAKVDARSDLYAVGVIAYRALSGRLPFEADSVLAWMKKHHLEQPLNLQIAMGETPLSPVLCGAIMRMLSKDPNQRPQSARQLKEELQAAIESSPMLPIATERRIKPPVMERLYVSQSKYALRSITQSDTSDLYAVGDNGLILLSSDHGESWDFVESQTEMALSAIWAGPRILCAVGMQGTIVCSQEGTHWALRATKIKSTLRALWGAGRRLFVVGDFGVGLQSEDAGKSWQSFSTGTREALFAIWGFEEERGLVLYLAGNRGVFLCSRDLGGTWEQLKHPLKGRITSLHGKTTAQLYAVTDDGHLLSVTPGEARAFKLHDVPLSQVRHLEDGRITTISTRGEFMEAQDPSHFKFGAVTQRELYAMYEGPEGLFFVGSNNCIIRYTAQEALFQQVFEGSFPHLFSLYQSQELLYLGGDDGFMGYSKNEGADWVTDLRPSLPGIHRLWRPSQGEYFFMCGTAGFLEIFDSKGGIWSIGGLEGNLNGLWGSRANDVYVVGEQGFIRNTADDGSSWQYRDSGSKATLCAIWGSGPDDVYIVGEGGLILHSIDEGFTWERQESATQEDLLSVFGFDREVFIVGAKGTILHSANQGSSWQKRYSPSKETFSTISGTGPSDLFICGERGTLLHSRDGGWTWQAWPTQLTSRLIGAHRTASGVIVYGHNGIVLRYQQSQGEELSEGPKTVEQAGSTLPLF